MALGMPVAFLPSYASISDWIHATPLPRRAAAPELHSAWPAELVKHHPGGLVTGQTKLPLSEQGRHTALVGGHQPAYCHPR